MKINYLIIYFQHPNSSLPILQSVFSLKNESVPMNETNLRNPLKRLRNVCLQYPFPLLSGLYPKRPMNYQPKIVKPSSRKATIYWYLHRVISIQNLPSTLNNVLLSAPQPKLQYFGWLTSRKREKDNQLGPYQSMLCPPVQGWEDHLCSRCPNRQLSRL